MKKKVVVVGLGEIGRPIYQLISKVTTTVGFDVNSQRIDELKNGIEKTREVDTEELSRAKYLTFSTLEEDIKSAKIYIVTVPTPIDEFKKPDLGPFTCILIL